MLHAPNDSYLAAFLRLNLAAAKTALEQSIESANAGASVKDVQDFIALRAKLTEAGVQYATAYSRGVYEVASEAQADFSRIVRNLRTHYAASRS